MALEIRNATFAFGTRRVVDEFLRSAGDRSQPIDGRFRCMPADSSVDDVVELDDVYRTAREIDAVMTRRASGAEQEHSVALSVEGVHTPQAPAEPPTVLPAA